MRRSKRGFTLVELLVVIGIIAVLIGVLLPSLSAAREQAKSVQCLSNLRQMVVSANAYVNEYQGRYPIAQYKDISGGTTTSYCWDFTMISKPPAPFQVVPGLLWNGQGPMQIQQCPSFEGGHNMVADPYTGYNYNTSYIGHGEGESIVAPLKATQIRKPSEVVIFGDGQYSAGANKFMRAPFDSGSELEGDDNWNSRTAGTQGYRHRSRTNVAFCDGHAESRKERYTKTDDFNGEKMIAKGTGFLGPDNQIYGGS